MSLTDTQLPLDVACNVVDMNGLFLELFDRPAAVKKLLNRIVDLLVERRTDCCLLSSVLLPDAPRAG